jgi:nitrite reductase/ring-hydroxylating ferredoxin subunit
MTVTSVWIRLCELNELPQTGARGFNLYGHENDDVFVVKCGDLLRTYRNSCPHQPGTTMPWRKHEYLDKDCQHIVCHGHGARFTLEEGLCLLGPCKGQFLQAVPLRIEDERYLSVLMPE